MGIIDLNCGLRKDRGGWQLLNRLCLCFGGNKMISIN